MVEVTAKKGAEGTPYSVDYDFGEDLDGMVELFGDEVVFHHARSSMVVALQGIVRNCESQEDAEKKAAEWKPGIRAKGKSQSEKMLESFEKMDESTKEALLAALASQISGKTGNASGAKPASGGGAQRGGRKR